jgi:hypothetical protein
MDEAEKRPYHHGDLRRAVIETALRQRDLRAPGEAAKSLRYRFACFMSASTEGRIF